MTSAVATSTLERMDEREREEREPAEDELSAAEAGRVRRRERERSAKDRELMRTGQAKAFKQILDAQSRRAAEAERRLAERAEDGDSGGDRRRPSR